MFGRFGFSQHATACSFLFFLMHTDFTHTTFVGCQQALRRAETPEERFHRRLREGFDFSGLEAIRDWPSQPPVAECFGPYDQSEHIFRDKGLTLLGLSYPTGDLVGPWGKCVSDLLNEMVLSYLERTVLPQIANQTVAAVAGFLFPNHTLTMISQRTTMRFFIIISHNHKQTL